MDSGLEVEYFLIADRADVHQEKLYLVGGGFTVVDAPELPIKHPVALAIGILVPWSETNIKHRFRVSIRHEDQQAEIVGVDGEFEAGRPVGIPPGVTQRVQVAVNLGLSLQNVGEVVAEIELNGQLSRRTSFFVVSAAYR